MNAMNATDDTDATTDETRNRPFDTSSFIINIKLLGVLKYNVNCDLFSFIHLFVADD